MDAAVHISTIPFGYGPTDDLWPFTLLAGARSFAAIADTGVVRLGRPDPSGPHYLTILFLLSQAIESALKSHLLIRGVTKAELVEIGHDLPRVLAHSTSVMWQPSSWMRRSRNTSTKRAHA
jgi:hypothetical protein